MHDRAKILKDKQRRLKIKAREIMQCMDDGSIDTVRKLGQITMSNEMLDKIEAALDLACKRLAEKYQSAG